MPRIITDYRDGVWTWRILEEDEDDLHVEVLQKVVDEWRRTDALKAAQQRQLKALDDLTWVMRDKTKGATK